MKITLGKSGGINELRKSFENISLNDLDAMNHTNETICVTDYKSTIFTQDVLEMCRQRTNSSNVPTFVIVSNTQGIMSPTTTPLDTPYTLSLCSVTSDKTAVFFFDETRGKVIKSKGTDVTDVRAVIEIDDKKLYGLCLFTVDDKKNFGQIKEDIRIGKRFFIEGMLIRGVGKKRSVRTQFNVIEYYFIVNKYFPIKDDMTFLKKTIPLINGPDDLALMWDYDLNKNPWDYDETMISLLALFYMEPAQSLFNLIVCGQPSSKKSGLLQAISLIFDTPLVAGTSVRGKGLVPSWGGSEFREGVLLQANYVALIDEWFRKFSQEGDKYNHFIVRRGLEQIMTVLDRTEQVASTGSGQFTYTFSNSLVCTDNMGHIQEVQRVNKEDSAVIKRYTFLLLKKESEQNGKDMFALTLDEVKTHLLNKLGKVKLSFEKYKLFGNYMRQQMSKAVEFDRKIVRDIATRVVKDTVVTYGDLKYEYQQKLRGLIKSVVVLNSLFRAKKALPARFVAGKQDYETFERLFRRLTEDHFKLMTRGDGVKRTPAGEGEKRDEQKKLSGEQKSAKKQDVRTEVVN